ncbi:MAG: CDP-alcohol phosphatidyltransferase family protein [Chitinispirillaceae bacterium]|nr:CDP-alcohol phosphatidyltransferase family protein [Chitinispirillaceae bacterium]
MNSALIFTLSRVVIAPLFALFFIFGYRSDSPVMIWAAVGCALLIELSDLFDGMIARSRGEVTDFGKVCDPVADSVSRQTVFISFMAAGIIPLWLYLVFFYRDAFMQLMRIVCASNGIVLAARRSGKIKAVMQAIATFAVLLIVLAKVHHLPWIPQRVGGMHTGFWVVLVTAIYTAASVIDYIIPNRAALSTMLRRKPVSGGE